MTYVTATKIEDLWRGIVTLAAFGLHKGDGSTEIIRWSLKMSEVMTLINGTTSLAVSAFSFNARRIFLLESGDHEATKGLQSHALVEMAKPKISAVCKGHAILSPGDSCALLADGHAVIIVKFVGSDGVRKTLVMNPEGTMTKRDLTPLIEELPHGGTSPLHVWAGFLKTTKDHEWGCVKEGITIRKILSDCGLDCHNVTVDRTIDICGGADSEGNPLWHTTDKQHNLVVVNHHYP